MLSRWRRELFRNGTAAFQEQGKTRDDEMARLKRELARMKKERDFLQEAAAFFAKASK
jgi:transposase